MGRVETNLPSHSSLLLYSSVKTGEKFFHFPSAPYSETVHWKQTRVLKHYFIVFFSCQISECKTLVPLFYGGMCMGEMHTVFLGRKRVLFSALINQKLGRGLCSVFQTHLFWISHRESKTITAGAVGCCGGVLLSGIQQHFHGLVPV